MENKFVDFLEVCYKEENASESCERKISKVNQLYDQGSSVLLIDEALEQNKSQYVLGNFKCMPIILDDWKGPDAFNTISRKLARVRDSDSRMIVITDAYGSRGVDF